MVAKRKFSAEFEESWSKNETSIVLTQDIKSFRKPQSFVLGVRICGHYTVPGAAILNIPIIIIINTVYPKESHFNLPSYVDSKMYDACSHQQKWAVCQATNTIAMLIIVKSLESMEK